MSEGLARTVGGGGASGRGKADSAGKTIGKLKRRLFKQWFADAS